MGFKNDSQRKAVMATLNNGASSRQSNPTIQKIIKKRLNSNIGNMKPVNLKGKKVFLIKHPNDGGISFRIDGSLRGWENTTQLTKEQAIDFISYHIDGKLNPLKLESSSSITLSNRKQEAPLRKIGVEIPTFPKQGKIRYKGKQIGFADNFNGVNITDKVFILTHMRNYGDVWYTN